MKNSHPLLERAIELAVINHKGQTDKADQPYILHPLRLMMSMDTDEKRIVAVLHDIVEDTPITLDNLREEGFGEKIVAAIDCVTKRDGELEEIAFDKILNRIRKLGIEAKIHLNYQSLTMKVIDQLYDLICFL